MDYISGYKLDDVEFRLLQLTGCVDLPPDVKRIKNFTFTVNQDGDLWHLHFESHDTGTIEAGHGTTFKEAWEDLYKRGHSITA